MTVVFILIVVVAGQTSVLVRLSSAREIVRVTAVRSSV
jgi:hypothetical protein